MTIIIDRNAADLVYFPKNLPVNKSYNEELRIHSELTQVDKSVYLTDLLPNSEIVFCFNLIDAVSDMQDGEYTFEILQNNQTISSGLLRIGNLIYKPITHKNKENIIQYD